MMWARLELWRSLRFLVNVPDLGGFGLARLRFAAFQDAALRRARAFVRTILHKRLAQHVGCLHVYAVLKLFDADLALP